MRWAILALVVAGGAAAQQPAWLMSEEEVAALEARVGREPGNEAARESIVTWCAGKRQRERGLPHAWWLVEKAPASTGANEASALIVNPPASAEELLRLEQTWNRHLSAQGDSVAVLLNAADFFAVRQRLNKAEELYLRALSKNGQGMYGKAQLKLSMFYAMLLINEALSGGSGWGELIAFNQGVRDKLRQWDDIEMVGRVGKMLSELGKGLPAGAPGSLLETIRFGEELLARARKADPENAEWRPAPAKAPEVEEPSERMVVSASEQKTLLKNFYEVAYPQGAKGRGEVRFRVVIGTNGKVRELSYLSGRTEFVKAAEEAVRRYEYEPRTKEGRAVEVETEVEVLLLPPK
jgi:hypothetical protein